MKVQCVICDTIDEIDEDSFIAKKLKNRPIHTYLCTACDERIRLKALDRIEKKKKQLEEETITK